MSKIINDGLDQYGAELSQQQQFGTPGVEWVNLHMCSYAFMTVFFYLLFELSYNKFGVNEHGFL